MIGLHSAVCLFELLTLILIAPTHAGTAGPGDKLIWAKALLPVLI